MKTKKGEKLYLCWCCGQARFTAYDKYLLETFSMLMCDMCGVVYYKNKSGKTELVGVKL